MAHGELNTTPVEPGAERTGKVLLVVGSDQLITHGIPDSGVVIGRSDDCDVVIDHRAFSRRHVIVKRVPALTVQDLGSTNGIRLGGKVHRGGDPIPLMPGESFHIGPFSLLVVDADAAEPSTDRSGRDRLVVDDPTATGLSPFVIEIAKSGVNVLVQGETGVGKDVLSHTLHELSGRSGPMQSINCATISESLLESELFGHEKGAFTGAVGMKQGLLEAAEGGTVFLDEIGEMPLALQAKLLRVVESREVRRLGSNRSIPIDVRIVAATNRDLATEVAAGRFRQDLFFRLDGVSLRIPPLRERKQAIGPLALTFIEEVGRRLGRTDLRATPDLLVALNAHDWPGNVRELKAVIERAVLLARGAQLGSRHLAFSADTTAKARSAEPAPAAAVARAPIAAPAEALDFLDAEQQADRARVIAALDECAGNQTRAAKHLGIARTTLVNKLALYRIPRPRT